MLTQSELKEFVHYDSNTGIFTWIKSTAKCIKIGSVAGSIGDGYIRLKIKYKSYRAHRLAWLYMMGEFPEKGLEIDHKNMNRSDNRWVNLRCATKAQNMQNRAVFTNSKSGLKGVSWDKDAKKWRARLFINGINKHLGFALTPEKAFELYKNAAEAHHKSFFRSSL
jgi:hypothetical protein